MPKKSSLPQRRPAGFIETMDCLPVSRLPEGPEWTSKINLDGYRLEAVRSSGRTTECVSVRLDRYMRLAIISRLTLSGWMELIEYSRSNAKILNREGARICCLRLLPVTQSPS
jgi:hypothetical protein